MARIEITMPKMGESIMEGTVVEWAKKIGDSVEQDETLLEIATDKVDSEIPAPEAGVLIEILVEEGETVEVGAPIAILETDAEAAKNAVKKDQSGQKAGTGNAKSRGEQARTSPEESSESENGKAAKEKSGKEKSNDSTSEENDQAGSQNGLIQVSETSGQAGEEGIAGQEVQGDSAPRRKGSDGRFYSPLVRAIAREEGVSQKELESLEGSGSQGRVTKEDVLDYVKTGKPSSKQGAGKSGLSKAGKSKSDTSEIQAQEMVPQWPQQDVEIIKMDRMRKVISEHMLRSKQTSAHVTTFGEADVTRLVQFREKNKAKFYQENGFKLTFTPFFIEATIQALREFPLLNSSVDGDNILLKRDINYGIAVALGESGKGGLVVPVIKNAGEMNVKGLARVTHQLAEKARNKDLMPDDLAGGTFTLTNYGSVGNLMGTPIINQPQLAIFGTGIIQKRPVVMEVDGSDTIAIRHMIYLSMSYDHRIIDGAMGGAFVQRVKQHLENMDMNRSI
ncbi:MAG: dihydrolipoamide acetyltransferase family protein [Balneolales bacterium]